MAQSVQNFATPYIGDGTTNHSFACTLGAGTNRKVTIAICKETAITVSSVAYNSVSATASELHEHTSAAGLQVEFHFVDVSDATSAGSYNVTFTSSAGTTALTGMAWQSVNSATGAPEATDEGETATATVSGVAGMSVSDGALILVAVVNAAATQTWDSYSAGVTQRVVHNEVTYTSGDADGIKSGAGTYTATATASSTGNKVLVAISIAAAAATHYTVTELTISSTAD